MEHKDNKEKVIRKKNVLGYFALFFVVFHFTTILITTFPKNYTPKALQTISNLYVSPLFNQKWGMFAPCPLTAHQLKFKLFFNNVETDTITPSDNYFKYHTWLRFTHHGDLATGEYNMMYWVKNDLDQLNIKANSTILESQKQAFKKTRGYFHLKNYLNGYALKYFQKKPVKTDIFLNYYDVKNHQLNTYTFNNLK
jgi:hypothetical protein